MGRLNSLNKLGSFFFLTFLFLLFPSKEQLQAQNLARHDKKLIHFGMSLGINQSKFGIDRSESFIFHDSIKVVDSPRSAGFNVGIVSDLHLGKHLDLRFIPTLIFAEKDLRYTEISQEGDVEALKTVESIILGFPLYLKFKSERVFDNFRFYVLGGVRVDWDFASNSKARKATNIVKIQPYDVSAEYGIGLEFFLPLFIFSPEIRFSHGLTNLHVPTQNLRYSDVIQKLKSRGFTIALQFEG